MAHTHDSIAQPEPKNRMTLEMPANLYSRLAVVASRKRDTKGAIVRTALEKYLKREEERHAIAS